MVKNLLLVFLHIPQEIISEKYEKDWHVDLCFKEDEWIPLNKKLCFAARIFSPVGLVARPVDLGQMLLSAGRKDTLTPQ